MTKPNKKRLNGHPKLPVLKPIPVALVHGEHSARVIFSLRRVKDPVLWSGLLTPSPAAFAEGRPDYVLHYRSINRDTVYSVADIRLCLPEVAYWLKRYLHLDESLDLTIKIVDREPLGDSLEDDSPDSPPSS